MTISPFEEGRTDFLLLYQWMCGKGRTPQIYHFWCGVSLLSALCRNRVWYQKYPDERMSPNFYVFLIGESVVGKSFAIGKAVKLAVESFSRGWWYKHAFDGRTTSAAVVDRLGKHSKLTDEEGNPYFHKPTLWLVNDELANDVGKGQRADDLVKFMTKIYALDDRPLDEATREHGHMKIFSPCVTWLVGTTETWMNDVLTVDHFKSGFGSRVCFIHYNETPKKMWRAEIPDDYQEVRAYLKSRLKALWHITENYGEGIEYKMTEDALAFEKIWYLKRPMPKDPNLRASWERAQDLLIKLGMMFAISEENYRTIEVHHLARAQRVVEDTEKHLPGVVKRATPRSSAQKLLISMQEFIEGKNVATLSEITNRFYQRKDYTEERRNAILRTFQQAGLVNIEFGEKTHTGRRTTYYCWKGVPGPPKRK